MSDEITVELEGEDFVTDTPERSQYAANPARIDLTDDEREEIKGYLLEQTKTALEERAGLEQKWAKWERQREVLPEFETKNTPWTGASNVVTPATRIATRAIAALLKEAFSDRVPFWTYEDSTGQMKEESKGMTEYVQSLAESPFHLDWGRVQNMLWPEASSIGTVFLKLPWTKRTRGVRVSDENGTTRLVEQTLKDGLDPIVIQGWEFITRPHYNDIQTCPWIDHFVHKNWFDLQELGRTNVYDPESVAAIEEAYTAGSDMLLAGYEAYRSEIDDRWGIASDWGRGEVSGQTWRIHEYWFDWIREGDEVPTPMIMWIEPITGTILREEYNRLGHRPFARLCLEKRLGRLYGIGTGWIAEALQDEVDTHHNLRVDATHMSTVKMYKAKKRSNVSPKEKIRPGKMWMLDNPRDDMMELQTGEVSPSSFQAEQVAMQMLDRGMGVNDALLGYSDSVEKTRSSVGGRVLQLQQRTKIFRSTVESLESDLTEVGMIIFYQMIAHKEAVLADVKRFPPEVQAGVRAFLEVKVEEIPTRVHVRVRTTPMAETESAKQQSMMNLIQLYSMYWKEVLQTAMLIENPQVPPLMKALAQKQFIGMTKRMEEIMKNFDEEEIWKKLPLQEMRQMEQQVEQALVKMQILQAIKGALQNGGRGGAGNTGQLPGPIGNGGAVDTLPAGPRAASSAGGNVSNGTMAGSPSNDSGAFGELAGIPR
jgi:hypothetical protein